MFVVPALVWCQQCSAQRHDNIYPPSSSAHIANTPYLGVRSQDALQVDRPLVNSGCCTPCRQLYPACAAKTHRELFSEWYEDLMGEPLAATMAANPQPAASKLLFDHMMHDITGGGGCADPMGQVGSWNLLHVFAAPALRR